MMNPTEINLSEGRKIFLQAVKRRPQASNGNCYPYSEFYEVDMKAGSVLRCPAAPLLNASGLGSMLALGSVVYIFGGLPVDPEDIIYCIRANVDYFHLKASSLNLSNPGDGWKAAPLLRSLETTPCCVSFAGKIYTFGGTESVGEVFDPNSGRWDVLSKLPPHIEQSSPSMDVSFPVIPDPSMNRILMHLTDISSLYAYYPDQGTWDCLVHKDFGLWRKLAALVDGVIYFHLCLRDSPFVGYDLGSKKWLKVVLSSEFDMDLITSDFDALLNFGSGTLCLAAYSPDFDSPKTHLIFVIFKLKRPSDSSEEVLATLVSVNTYAIESSCKVRRFILL